MVVNPEQHTPDKRTVWRAFTFAAFDGFFASNGRTDSPTPQCLNKQTPSASTTRSVSDVYDGSITYTGWTMGVYPKTSYMWASFWKSTNQPSSFALQGCLQTRHEIDRIQLNHLGIARRRPQWLEICSEGVVKRDEVRRKKHWGRARAKERQQNQ